MKYSVFADGQSATVELNFDGNGNFTGAIHTADGQHNGNLSGTGNPQGALSGKAQMDGHSGTFQASISGKSVSGSVTVSVFFFSKTVSFTGSEIDTPAAA